MNRNDVLNYQWINTKFFCNGQIIVNVGYEDSHYTMACFLTAKYYNYLFKQGSHYPQTIKYMIWN